MPRWNLDSTMSAHLTDPVLYPAILVQVQYASEQICLWSGVGPLAYGSKTYTGLGTMGAVADVVESVGVIAEGTSVALSGLSSTLLAEALSDVRLGAPCAIAVALLDPAQTGSGPVILGAPCTIFQGLVGPAAVVVNGDNVTIAQAMEPGAVYLQRASNRRYTSADQNLTYPTDRSMFAVEALNDQALLWG